MYNKSQLMQQNFATRITRLFSNHICSSSKSYFSTLIVKTNNKKFNDDNPFMINKKLKDINPFKKTKCYFMTVNEFIRINYARLNKDVYLQGLALGFWESRYVLLEYKQKNMMQNKLSFIATCRLSKNIYDAATKTIKQLEEFKPCNQHSELFKKDLLKKFKRIQKQTLQDDTDYTD